MHEHRAEPLALPALAREASLSRYHFLRLFHRAFGETPHQYLIRLRLEQAKALLAADRASVTDVCFEVGFSSLGSFSTLFAERVGCPPSAWRRRVWRIQAHPYGLARLGIPCCFWRQHTGLDIRT